MIVKQFSTWKTLTVFVRYACRLRSGGPNILLDLQNSQADMVSLKIWGVKLYIVTNSHYIKRILVKHGRSLCRPTQVTRALKPLVVNSLPVSEENAWRVRRNLLQPLFQRATVEGYISAIVKSSTMIDDWRNQDWIDLEAEARKLFLVMDCKVLLDVNITSEETAGLSSALDRFRRVMPFRILFALFAPEWVPLPFSRNFQHTTDQIHGIIDELLSRSCSPYVSLFDATVQDSDALSMRDETVGLVLSGHQTTAVAFTWALVLLASHPNLLTKLQREIDAVFDDPRQENLNSVVYTNPVTKEALRLFPPFAAITRQIKETIDIDGCLLKPGAFVFLNQYGIHRDPRYFQSPHDFHPERFTQAITDKAGSQSYFPFGKGPHMCIGKYLSVFELDILLATIIRNFDLSLFSEDTYPPIIRGKLVPYGRPKLKIKPRRRHLQTV